jgi:hypothetical protein
MKTSPAQPATLPVPTESASRDSRGRTVSRRQFIRDGGAAVTATAAAATAAFTLVPRHVLGGAGFVAPSQKINLAYIGCGTQGLREMLDLLAVPEIQIVAVCDPVRDSHDYVDWSSDGLRSAIAQFLRRPDWRRGRPGIPGGREVAKEIVELAYGDRRAAGTFKGCAAYADFRELLEKEGDVNAVKVMTPDHLHAAVAIAAMMKGKHVVMHKPLANRLLEARAVIETARRTGVATHFLPASDGARIRTIKAWIDDGAIGTLREIHNWSNRPVWPQYPAIPTDRPPVPDGFDWPLWLGPSVDRPYHPHYTHAVFRGWYEFGGGSLADMGHYSLWPVFREFDLDAPVWVESRPSHVCTLQGAVAVKVRNDYSFPAACTIRFHFAAKGARPALDLHWYDGSMRPPTPDELDADGQELPAEGMLFVGDQGKILAEFLGDNARIIPESRMRAYRDAKGLPAAAERGSQRNRATADWIAACRGGPATFGDFLQAGPISDAFNLGAVSLRLGGRRLEFDATSGKVTNLPEANAYLGREYRKGWEWAGGGKTDG